MATILIYADIMGFEEKAMAEAKLLNRPEKDIRYSYVSSVNARLENLTARNKILNYKELSLDSWGIFVNNIWQAFMAIHELQKVGINFEFAIGLSEVDFDVIKLDIYTNEYINYLKSYLIPKYNNYYKHTHGFSPKESYILLSEEIYRECEQINYKNYCTKPIKEENFYYINLEVLETLLIKYEFLEEIETVRYDYFNIKELYVEPLNYKDIIYNLEKYNIVFLIGDPEVGKTFTSIKIMYDFYKKGYKPLYVPEENSQEQWKVIRGRNQIDRRVVYLEDPWGKIKLITSESLFKEIGSFIRSARSIDCKVIITSRYYIFKEFERRKETAIDFSQYAIELNLTNSYDKSLLIEMFNKYIAVFRPAWCDNSELRNIAAGYVGTKIKTPAGIKNLFDITKEDTDRQELIMGIEEASIETKMSFSSEIWSLFDAGKYEYLVFFGLAYLSVELKSSKKIFDLGIRDLNDLGFDSIRSKSFEELFREFNGRRIEVSSHILRFIHPSYEEAFESSLTENKNTNKMCNIIFCKILFRLVKVNHPSRLRLLYFFKSHPTILHNNIISNQILDELLEDDEVLKRIAFAWMDDIRFPDLLERKAKFGLARMGWWNISGEIASFVRFYLNELPPNKKCKIFNNLDIVIKKIFQENYDYESNFLILIEENEELKAILNEIHSSIPYILENYSDYSKYEINSFAAADDKLQISIDIVSDLVKSRISELYSKSIMDPLLKDLF